MKTAWLSVALVAAVIMVAGGQAPPDPRLQAQLKQLFPSATTFTPKDGNPPHFKALEGALPTLLGYAFWTTEVEPLERGYDGPIKILVGLDTKGVLTDIIVVEHHEPYGSFSVEPPQFARQFKGKSIREPFKVGEDIDEVSRASITILSATRAIRNSSRRIARAYLAPPDAGK